MHGKLVEAAYLCPQKLAEVLFLTLFAIVTLGLSVSFSHSACSFTLSNGSLACISEADSLV